MNAKYRATLFIALAAAAAGTSLYVARIIMLERESAVSATASLETEPIVIARSRLLAGEAIKPNQLSIVRWPAEYLPEEGFAVPGELAGRVLRRTVEEGEPLLQSMLTPQGSEAGLISLIQPKRRAMSVKVDPVLIVAGFVTPGSRVDVLATLRLGSGSEPSTGVILQNIRVLAIDQQLDDNRGADPEQASVVTLEVTPEEAQRLAYAVTEGELQLVLRNSKDAQRAELPGVTGGDLISASSPKFRRTGRKTRIQVTRGGKTVEETL